MKKMSKSNANKIYGLVKDTTAKGVEIKLPISDNKGNPIKVKVYPFVSAAVKSVIADEVAKAAMIDDEYNRIYRDVQLAKCIIEHMTDIPLPMKIDEKTEEEYVDLNMCYDIVEQLLMDDDAGDLWAVRNYLISVVMDQIDTLNRVSIIATAINCAAPGELAQKVLDLYELLKAELADLESNPARIAELIDNIPEDKLNEFMKAFGLDDGKQNAIKPEFSVVK